MVVSANAGGNNVNKDVIPNAGSVATVTFEGGEKVNKDVITNADSVNNKPAAVAKYKAKADINIEAPGSRAKKMAWSHPDTKGGTIPGLTETKYQGVTASSGATSVAKHHRDDDSVKAAARPEIFDFPGPRAKKIAPGHLKKPPLQSHPNTKGGTITGLTEAKYQGGQVS